MLKNVFLCIVLLLTGSSCAQRTWPSDPRTLNNKKVGKKEGVWTKKYFLSNKLKSHCEYKNGKKSGVYCKYYKSGFLKVRGEYVNNRKSGTECFYRDKVRFESIKHCIKYENGKKRGRIKEDFLENI